jgi:hypothetical protein
MSSPSMSSTADVTVNDPSDDDLIELEISEDEETSHAIDISLLFDILENFDVYGEESNQP